MALNIQTFDNRAGAGSAFFKAAGHPLCLPAAQQIIQKIQNARSAAAFDPHDTLVAFAAVHALPSDIFTAIYAQDVARFGQTVLGCEVSPITELSADTDVLFVPAFDAAPIVHRLRRVAPSGCDIVTLDDMRLPERFLSDTRRYLNPVNFATNFLFFRDEGDSHTCLVTANYWSAYGAKEPFVWGRVFAADGEILTDFEKPLGGAHEIFSLDSAKIKEEFKLPDFCGQVFLHVARAAGHDIVKYVADSYGKFSNGESGELSCTHDANSWPADLYAGVPAPGEGDSVILWVQNSHPSPIPAGAVGINRMGEDDVKPYPEEIPSFATRAVDIGALLPDTRWPGQIEIRAGRYFVRPRYEVVNRAGRRRINHANVERTDLQADKDLPKLSHWLGKGYILPAPILPCGQFDSECLPTPMSTAQQNLPLAAAVYNAAGEEIHRVSLGCLSRNHERLLNLSEMAAALGEGESGHLELVYDFADGGDGDGWMHALFRYTEKQSGHVAETSFGAHMFNHLLTYKNEPQSYKGPPPGLTTRLFLRVAREPVRTFCHLIYPVGKEWNPHSETHFDLKNRRGEDVAQKTAHIAAGGSFAFCCQDLFTDAELQDAGEESYVIIRDSTCRLFGYHGAQAGGAFAFDHMFGF